jgi:uncharacterized protein YndB with AHSA1/START domain
MAPIVSTIEIARPPAEVFAYATDPLRFPEWQRDVVRVRLEGAGAAVVGTRFVTTRRIGRFERTLTQEITTVDAPARWAARGVDGPVRPDATIEIEPLDGGTRSRVTFGLDFDGHGIGKLIVPLAVRRQAERGAPVSYRRLKELLESGRDGNPQAAA